MSEISQMSFLKRQDSLRRHYVDRPADAWITDQARAWPGNSKSPIHGVVEPANSEGSGLHHGIHHGVGGDHDAPNPGDLLSAALAACLHSTLRMVAQRLEVKIITSEVTATAHADVRGALMVDATVPVGFQRMHCDVYLKVPASMDEGTLKALMVTAEDCCVVLRTLKEGTRITTEWQIDKAP